MMDGWRECKLGDFLNLKRGYDLPQQQRRPGSVPIISSSGFSGHHNEAKVKGPGVVTGRYGTLGEVFFVERDFWPLNTSLYVQDFKGNDARFVAYFLRQLNFGSKNAAGAVPGVNRNHLHAMDVRVPPLSAQQRISSILCAYDDLIENCERRIKVLEDTVRSIYREWFVEFRFPGGNRLPRVETELGAVPNGWKCLTLVEVTSKIGSGATPRGGKESYKQHGLPLIRSLNVYDYEFSYADLAFIDAEQAALLDGVSVQPRDVLLNITGASVARCTIVPGHLVPARVNQHVAIVRFAPGRMDPYYLLDTINAEANKQKLLAFAQGGATREALTKETIERFPIVVPSPAVLAEYARVAGPLHEEREVLARQVGVLCQTRDLLLPRLLSGQLGLAEAV